MIAKHEMELELSTDKVVSDKAESSRTAGTSRRTNMKHRLLSEDSIGCDQETSTESVWNVVREIMDNRIPSLSIELSNLSKDAAGDEESWRGWILVGEIRPIALLTSDPYLKKDKGSKKTPVFDVTPEEDIVDKLVQAATDAGYGSDTISVFAVKNVKLKVKTYTLSDLERYDTRIRRSSGTSLFKEDRTGLRQGRSADVYEDITTKYDLPDVYREEGSQASSTRLRIFKATVTLRKQPTCSLNEKSRERLFLMFSPSDDNVLDIMNNSQIKNKMLRHQIGTYLKPSKTARAAREDVMMRNAPLYKERHIPRLVPVTDPGILGNYPPLTTEILYDHFFKESEIRKDGYIILLKEQPLLIENMTLCEIPKYVTSMTQDRKPVGFVPRYSFKERMGENKPEVVKIAKEPRLTKERSLPSDMAAQRDSGSEQDDSLLVDSIVSGRLCSTPGMPDDIDERLTRLKNRLSGKAKPHLELSDTEVHEELPTVKIVKSKWDQFEQKGDKVRQDKEIIVEAYKEIEKRLEEEAEARPVEQREEIVSTGGGSQPVEELEDVVLVELEDSVLEAPDLEAIMARVDECKTRLKKELVEPIVKPPLAKHLNSGKKRFYLRGVQEYWGDYHADVNTFYHNPLLQSGHSCNQPVIENQRMVSRSTVLGEEEETNIEEKSETSSEDKVSTVVTRPNLPPVTPIISSVEVDEIKHELASPKYTYSQDKTSFAGLVPSTYYQNSKKEIVALSYCERFLKNYYKLNGKRRKLFLCVENELGVQKIVSTTIKPTGSPFKSLHSWQALSKFVANNVKFIPLHKPIFLPHALSSPTAVLDKGKGHGFELSTLLVSLLIGQGYDAYVVSGYASALLTTVESCGNYLRYDCPHLLDTKASDPLQAFNTKSHIIKTIEKERKPIKQSTNYRPTVAPFLDSSYHRQNKLDKEREKEEEIQRTAQEDEEMACKRYLSLFEADELEGRRVHSWVLVLKGKRDVDHNFFLEPSSGFAYGTDDPHYFGIESLWNHSNYWIHRKYTPYRKVDVAAEEAVDNTPQVAQPESDQQPKEKDAEEFDLSNNEIWLPVLVNGPQIFKEDKNKKNKAEAKAKILRLQKSLDMPSSWCGRISITTNQVERRINEPYRTRLYKRAVCLDYQAGINDDGLVAKVTKFSDLARTDPEFEVQVFEKRQDSMYRRRRDIVSDKLTEYFAFGREDCLQSHEFIDGAEAMYCDHNLFFEWDFRDDGLISVHMTDLYLKLDYGGRKDKMTGILVLYGSSIEDGKRARRKGAQPGESGRTPRKEITTIVQQFEPSSDLLDWNDVAKVTYRLTKGQVIVEFQYESSRVTVTTKLITKGHDDPEVGQAIAEIAKKKRNREDDQDCQSELDLENFEKYDDLEDSEAMSEDNEEVVTSSKSKSTGTQSDRKIRKGKKMSIMSLKLSRKSLRADIEMRKIKRSDTRGVGSEESIRSTRSSRSSMSESSFGASELECSSADEKEVASTFYPANLVADKDKSLWACSHRTRTFVGRKLLNSLFRSKDNRCSNVSICSTASLVVKSKPMDKISDFGHLAKDSSHESSGEEEEYLKELRKRQIKAISETNELYKAIERDEANPNVRSITSSGKSQKLQLCKLEHLENHAKKIQSDKKAIQIMKNKLDEHMHQTSVLFPNEKLQDEAVTHQVVNVKDVPSEIEEDLKVYCYHDSENNEASSHFKLTGRQIRLSLPEKRASIAVATVPDRKKGNNLAETYEEEPKEKEYLIDPLIVGIYTDTDRCLDDPLSMTKKRPFSRGEAKMRNIFNAVKNEMSGEDGMFDHENETGSLDLKFEGEGTLSEEEAANEKDVDSVEGEVYNSDDNYSLQSRNASSRECPSSEEDEEEEEVTKPSTCYSENEEVIEYETEAPKHCPYDFKGFHFQAGKMYARKLYQQKEVCDNVAIDSDHESSYDGDEDYAADFLQGEIDKFLENTVDKITQDVREARNLIGGLKKGSDINLEQTGVYYCNLSDRYINYVDSYFRKINKKREHQSDKAFLMEMLKQRAKEPDKIIKHIREYIVCKKNGIKMELDENLMNLIPHVRPVEVKKKDRLGYEILTDEDGEEDVEPKASGDEEEQAKPESIRESIEPVNITTAELVHRLGASPKAVYLMDAVNNFKKFKDMETVNQLIQLPLHECFSDVNIRNHLQNTKVNDGYFIDAKVDGKVRLSDDDKNPGFVTDPEHILLSKDMESVLSSQSDSDDAEQEVVVKHMEVMTSCGKETMKDADFFEPIYQTEKCTDDPFTPQRFRMFAPLEASMLDSDSDGSINTRIKLKRRKAFKPAVPEIVKTPSLVSTATTLTEVSTATDVQQRHDVDRAFGLQPFLQKTDGSCRVSVKNMSTKDNVSDVDKAITLETFLSMEDEMVNYIRNIEAYIFNLLIKRKKERKCMKRNILFTSRKGIRRANFKVLNEKLREFNELADKLSFDWDLLSPYLHLLLPEDNVKKFTHQTAAYIQRLLIIDFIERELFKLKGLYNTYEKARLAVVEKKNVFLSELENMSFGDKEELEKVVNGRNEALRREADRAHILRFVILRRAKQSTKKFRQLINNMKNDERIGQAYCKARERIILADLSKRWPEHFESIYNFSGLPVASEPNDFTSSYISPVDDIIIRKILKQVRKKPAKFTLTENTYERYLELMERDREYFQGLKRKQFLAKKKRSLHSIFLAENLNICVDGKNSDFIDKLELVNNVEWADFFLASESFEDITMQPFRASQSWSDSESRKTSFEICSKSLLEELLMIKKLESVPRMTKETSRKKTYSNTASNLEEEQNKKDLQFFEKYGSPQARQLILNTLPEYFQYI